MPADLPHWRTVYDVADGWHKSGAPWKMHDELRRQCRIAAGRQPEPTAAVIDFQSVKAAEEVSRASRGYYTDKVVPRPADWSADVDVAGCWWTAWPHSWQPPGELVSSYRPARSTSWRVPGGRRGQRLCLEA